MGDHHILGGRYEVGRLLGRGGMAEVYLGRDQLLGRTVAIKMLRHDLARDMTFQARFRREAQSSASLNHPDIVAVYDTGEDVLEEPGGDKLQVPFIVMEYVEGHTLKDLLAQDGPMTLEHASEIFSKVLSALDYSHRHGIVHRDIKPANVMVTPSGGVKVMDFGIARAVADGSATFTQTSTVIGTAQYLSPEQARGETVDARSDLYSAACLYYELLTGRPPFVGDSPVAVAYQHVSEPPKPPSHYRASIPPAVDQVVLHALAKNRDDRYPTAAAFRDELAGALAASADPRDAVPTQAYPVAAPPTAATRALSAEPTSVLGPLGEEDGPDVQEAVPEDGDPDDPARKKKRRHAAWYWVIGILALLAIGGAAAWFVLSNRTPEVTTVKVPDVTNLTYARARANLTDVGLKTQRVNRSSDSVDSGNVIRTNPPAQQRVSQGSTVRVVVSTGPSSVTVPDVTNQTQSGARQLIEEAGLEVGDVRTVNSATVPADRVVRTDPASGSSASPGDSVTLFISNGQVELPDLRGKSRGAATQTLQKLGLSAEIQFARTGDAEQGHVVDQNPGAGLVGQGTQVVLVIARKPLPESPTSSPTPNPTSAPATQDPAGTDDQGGDDDSGQ